MCIRYKSWSRNEFVSTFSSLSPHLIFGFCLRHLGWKKKIYQVRDFFFFFNDVCTESVPELDTSLTHLYPVRQWSPRAKLKCLLHTQQKWTLRDNRGWTGHVQWHRFLSSVTLSRTCEKVTNFPVNHCELSSSLITCERAVGCLLMPPCNIFGMSLCCVPQLSCAHTWQSLWQGSLEIFIQF